MIISSNIQDIRYIRGATLRSLQRRRTPRVASPDLPLLSRTLSLLRPQKRCLRGICHLPRIRNLIPDAPELLQTFLTARSDATCKRIAFVILAHCAMSKAVQWILSVYEQISGLVWTIGDERDRSHTAGLKKWFCTSSECHIDNELVLYAETAHKARYIQCIFELLQCLVACHQIWSCYHPDDFNTQSGGCERWVFSCIGSVWSFLTCPSVQLSHLFNEKMGELRNLTTMLNSLFSTVWILPDRNTVIFSTASSWAFSRCFKG